ncbi:hypothetical protein EMIT053CA3_70119 [Pseudomonas donghuensis]
MENRANDNACHLLTLTVSKHTYEAFVSKYFY